MAKPTYNSINTAIQNADLTHFQINKLIKVLESKRQTAVFEVQPMDYSPSSTAITTLEQAQNEISELEKHIESYHANVDAMLFLFQKDERLYTLKKPNGKLEPHYTSSQLANYHWHIWERATQVYDEFISDVLVPYDRAVARLQMYITSIVDSVFDIVDRPQLQAKLTDASGELSKVFEDMDERRHEALITGDIEPMRKDVDTFKKLIKAFVKSPTWENQKALINHCENYKGRAIEQLLEARAKLPKKGRTSGAVDYRVTIWQYAEQHFKQGSEHAGEMAIKALEAFMQEKRQHFKDSEIKEIFRAEWQALDTLKFTTIDGVRCERKRIDANDGGSLAAYMRLLAYDARNGKLKVAFEK